MDLGERIKAARQHAGLTQAGLAKLVGVSQQMIGKIETGNADGSQALLNICIETGVSPRWLARGEGEMESHSLQLAPAIIARTHAELDTHYATLAGKDYDIEADPDLFARAYLYFSKEREIIDSGEKFDFARWLAKVMKGSDDGSESSSSGGTDRTKGKGRKPAKT